MKWRAPDQEADQKRTWTENVKKNCHAHKLNKEDAMDYSTWKKLIRMVDDQDR